MKGLLVIFIVYCSYAFLKQAYKWYKFYRLQKRFNKLMLDAIKGEINEHEFEYSAKLIMEEVKKIS